MKYDEYKILEHKFGDKKNISKLRGFGFREEDLKKAPEEEISNK